MASIYYDTWLRGGIARTYELLRDGHTSHQLTAAVRRGEVVRVRQGHYACPELSEAETRAVRVGGRLAGLSAARHHGLWTPRDTSLEVSVAPDSRALRSPTDKSTRLSTLRNPGVTVHWTDRSAPGTRSTVGVLACLIDVAKTQPARVTFTVVESALHLRRVSPAAWRRAVRVLPQPLQVLLSAVSALSGSGGESLAKYEFIATGIHFAQQVSIDGVGRVDFVVGDRLVVEIDGAEFHTSREAFEEDRRRDAGLRVAGYRVLRFSYAQVSERWHEVEGAIGAAIGEGDHRW